MPHWHMHLKSMYKPKWLSDDLCALYKLWQSYKVHYKNLTELAKNSMSTAHWPVRKPTLADINKYKNSTNTEQI